MFTAKRFLQFLFHAFVGQFTFYANPADEWSGADLSGVARGGQINEDVMQKIWDISNVPLEFSDRLASGAVGNANFSWTVDELSAPDLTNAAIDGVDSSGNDAKAGERQNNHAQISTKNVSVTTRARHSNTIGRSDELAYQVARRQIDLRRDIDAILMSNQASVADDGDTVAGKTGGLASWIATNGSVGATGTIGGWAVGTGLTVAYLPGTKRALSEALIRDTVQAVYQEGGESSVALSNPQTIRLISEYMFSDTARVAVLQSDQGKSREQASALGSVNFFVTDFGSLQLVSSRTYVEAVATVTELFILDFSLLSEAILAGVRTEPLAKVGLADKRLMSCDYGLKVLNEKGQGMIADIDTATPMVA